MPRKIRELEADLKKAGYVKKAGKGSHRNYKHPVVKFKVTISGKEGSDAKDYQEDNVEEAIRKAGE